MLYNIRYNIYFFVHNIRFWIPPLRSRDLVNYSFYKQVWTGDFFLFLSWGSLLTTILATFTTFEHAVFHNHIWPKLKTDSSSGNITVFCVQVSLIVLPDQSLFISMGGSLTVQSHLDAFTDASWRLLYRPTKVIIIL